MTKSEALELVKKEMNDNVISNNENTWTIVTDNKGITFSNDKIPLKEHYNGGLMMTYKEALNLTNDSISQGHILPEQENYSYMYKVSEALEKQIPLPPYDKKFATVVIHYCPRCGEDLELHPNFCSKCGQSILWE